jgi:GNAT superfamily N-acetyltransferase
MVVTDPLPAYLAEAGFEVRGIEAFAPEEIVSFIHDILNGDCQMDARQQLDRSVAKFFSDHEADGDRRFFLALSKNDRLCGFTVIDRYNDRTATLKWIFVGSEFRGKRMGSWLLDSALSFARSAGYEKAILCTATSMEAAHHLYRSKGFVFKQWVTFWRQKMQVYENILGASVPELAK